MNFKKVKKRYFTFGVAGFEICILSTVIIHLVFPLTPKWLGLGLVGGSLLMFCLLFVKSLMVYEKYLVAHRTLVQLLKFAVLGVLNMVLFLAIINFSISFLHLSASIFLSLIVFFAYVCSILQGYIWNRNWIFPGKLVESEDRTLIHFFTISLVNLSIMTLTSHLLFPYFDFAIPIDLFFYNVCMASVTLVTMVLNFLYNKNFVFRIESF